MTTAEIIAYCDERDIGFSATRLAARSQKSWYARVGRLENGREGSTFESAIAAAWAAYTGEVA